MKSSPIQKGFTLVELLIVVIILAILAAIVVPQFANTTRDANLSALDSNLTNIRSVIDLYAQQHGGKFPGHEAATSCDTAAIANAAAAIEDSFLNQLAYYSDASGGICNVRSGGAYPLGPYLTKTELPDNPVSGTNALTVVLLSDTAAGDLTMTGDSAGGGWKYDPTSGKFIADDTDTDDSGERYDAR